MAKGNSSKTSEFSEGDWNDLLNRIKRGQCTPFLGSEAESGELPARSEIAKEWALEYRYPLGLSQDLAQVAQFVATVEDFAKPRELLIDRLKRVKPPDFNASDEPHGILADLRLPVYVTTNYDNFMYLALKDRRLDPRRELYRWNPRYRRSEPSELELGRYEPTSANPVVFHLYGNIDTPASLVLTEDDYLDFLIYTSRDPKLMPARIEDAFTASSLLFIGYRLTDMEFRVLLRSLVERLEVSMYEMHVSVQLLEEGEPFTAAELPKIQEYFERYCRKRPHNIRVYWGSSRQFMADLKRRWKAMNDGH